ncbi:hypothetical protein ABTM09_20365, partial [Acinetobacter baumannii]
AYILKNPVFQTRLLTQPLDNRIPTRSAKLIKHSYRICATYSVTPPAANAASSVIMAVRTTPQQHAHQIIATLCLSPIWLDAAVVDSR